jgi:hypothetical protein
MGADLDPHDLHEVRRRVVEPVVRSVIGPEELGDVDVYTDNDEVYVRVTARGELVSWCFLGSVDDEPWDAAEMAERLYDLITDDLPTTRFAWAEQREGRYEVPGSIKPRSPGVNSS